MGDHKNDEEEGEVEGEVVGWLALEIKSFFRSFSCSFFKLIKSCVTGSLSLPKPERL